MGELVPALMSEKIIIPRLGKQSRAGAFRSTRLPRSAASPPASAGAELRLISATPRSDFCFFFFFKEKVRGRARNSPHLLIGVRSAAARVVRCPQREIRGETAAPWRPGGRAATLCLRVCVRGLPPPSPGSANKQAAHPAATRGSLRDPALGSSRADCGTPQVDTPPRERADFSSGDFSSTQVSPPLIGANPVGGVCSSGLL